MIGFLIFLLVAGLATAVGAVVIFRILQALVRILLALACLLGNTTMALAFALLGTACHLYCCALPRERVRYVSAEEFLRSME